MRQKMSCLGIQRNDQTLGRWRFAVRPDGGTGTPLLDRPLDSVNGADFITHYAHPRSLDKTWCGAEREPKPYERRNEDATCVVCRDLEAVFGFVGWNQGAE
jgi:hypothetical protein